MATISELKGLTTTQTPLFLFHFLLPDGTVRTWSTHQVEVDGEAYEARVLGHNLYEMRSDSEDGMDCLSRLSVTLANADSYCSQIQHAPGWKGTRVTVRFLFFNLKDGVAASESTVVLRGVAGSPEEITETTLRLPVSNRMNLQRVLLPEVRIQRRCPWKFPASAEQRAEAVSGGKYSPHFRCGYSPDVEGGVGSMRDGAPIESCDYTRLQCEERGMFDRDQAGAATRRFGGVEFVPPSTMVRTYGDKSYHLSPVVENEARYNDFVPLIYGTGWYAPPIVFARNDGNLTRLEVLLGMGEIEGVLRVVVNDVEIPQGQAGANMTATGWYNVASHGGRTGGFNPDYTDAAGNPVGDPYGSMAFLSVVVPNRVNDGRSLPKVQVMLQGLKLDRHDTDGGSLGSAFSNNPAWVILDILRRSGWRPDEIDFGSFARAAEYCAGSIEAKDLHGNLVLIPRFQCNLLLRKRKSVASLLRGISSASRLSLTLDDSGRLQLRGENSLALQQAIRPEGSNSEEPLNGGWPAYEFGDGTDGFTGILRRSNGDPAIRLWTRSAADTPNRFSVEFQDEFNEYQQDSLSLVDVDDVLRTGQEVNEPLNAAGLPNFHQAARIMQLQLDKSLRGNTYVQFETSVRAAGLKPGDMITLTYLKEGYLRQPFRIKSVAPGTNYRTASITAQIHSDDWYTDEADGSGAGTRRQPGFEIGAPRPLVGSVLDAAGEPQFEIVELSAEDESGARLRVGFATPRQAQPSRASIPLVSLSATVEEAAGSLAGDQTLYYAVSAVGNDQSESPLSFLVRASLPAGPSTFAVRLTALSFAPGTTAFHVYRGKNPIQLLRIASAQAPAGSFTDSGLASELIGPPDENYDHANFYWRLEQQPPAAATLHSLTTIGNTNLHMVANAWRGSVIRILDGKGLGQERSVLSNTDTTLELATAWETEPDASSSFVVAEAGWKAGAAGRTGPIEFDVPNRVGATVHISGRSANVNGKECAYELSPLTRWRIGGTDPTPLDLGPPGMPIFGIYPTGHGSIELMGIGFAELTNTRSITAGTLTVCYWPELASPTQISLAEAVDADEEWIGLSATGGAQADSLIQIGTEILSVAEVVDNGTRYRLSRGVHGSQAEIHAAGSPVFHLSKKIYILPFPKDFFGSPASGNHSFPVYLPDSRISSAELVVTNARGNSEPGQVCLTAVADGGLRTLSGGQLSIQIEGYLAVQSNAAPPLVIEAAHSVRDIFAVVAEAPAGGAIELDLLYGEELYCRLTIPEGETMSNVVNGFNLPPLAAGEQLRLDIVGVPPAAAGTPGRDLTVTVRL